MQTEITLFWHRRDLRIEDNAGLYHALKESGNVVPIFIFDTAILSLLPKEDARVTFIHERIHALKSYYQTYNCDLKVFYGEPQQVFHELCTSYSVKAVYCNEDYEPYAKERDTAISKSLSKYGIQFFAYKDHVFFDYKEVLKDDGNPYTVFTPYSKRWLSRFNEMGNQTYPSEKHLSNLHRTDTFSRLIQLDEMGFVQSKLPLPKQEINTGIIQSYAKLRDFPSQPGTTKLGIHLRFGTLSIRSLVLDYIQTSPKWVSELIWRDFYAQILAHFPHVAKGAFKPDYDNIEWRNNEAEFERWKNGDTGIAIVDAGMRELKATGFMHNRVRMIVASYLCKNLLIDWKWGEAWFAEQLLDFDLASNNGGWQWAAGSGVDAAPYFRIFNPELQTQKFDPQFAYIRKWVPEFQCVKYLNARIVDHVFARKRCLEVYQAAVKK